MTVSRGAPEGAGRRVGVVVARFHEHVTAKLLEGALSGLSARGRAVIGEVLPVASGR